MVSTTAGIGRPEAKPAKRKQLHPFLPAAMHKPQIIRWLKHLHAWFGVSGAIAGIIFSWSGFVLNHRADFKVGAPNVTFEETLPAPAARTFADGDAFGRYIRAQLNLHGMPRPPGMGPMASVGAAVPGGVVMGTPTRFKASFQAASNQIAADYTAGDEFIKISRQERPMIRTLNRMHQGQAPNMGWQVVMDGFSGALIFLCISGVLIWSRLDGSRLLGAALIAISVSLVAYWIVIGP